MYFTCPLSSTRHLGLSFWRRRREPSLKRQPECFLGRSTHQLSPPLAMGVRTGFHLSWARECSVPPAWARLSLTFSSASPCVSAFYCIYLFIFCITVIKYADKSNLREREFISAQNSELQTITVEDVPGAGARGCWLCMLLKSLLFIQSVLSYLWHSLPLYLCSSVPCLSSVSCFLHFSWHFPRC